MGLFNVGGGLLPSTMLRQCVRDVVDEDEDQDEMLQGCLLNILESENEWKMSDPLIEYELLWGSGVEGGEEMVEEGLFFSMIK